jgi:hypothetical protein
VQEFCVADFPDELIDTELATTVAFLLDTSEEHAQRLISDLSVLNKTDSNEIAVVVDLILKSTNSSAASDNVILDT